MVWVGGLDGLRSPSEAEATACFERLPEEDDDECRECEEGFDRSENVARAAVVFSRATAKESRLCLGAEEEAVLPSESRELAECVKAVGETLRGNEAYGAAGWGGDVTSGINFSRSCGLGGPSGGFGGKWSVESGWRRDDSPPVM